MYCVVCCYLVSTVPCCVVLCCNRCLVTSMLCCAVCRMIGSSATGHRITMYRWTLANTPSPVPPISACLGMMMVRATASNTILPLQAQHPKVSLWHVRERCDMFGSPAPDILDSNFIQGSYVYNCIFRSDIFLRSSIGGLAYVTVFNSSVTWAATFHLWGYKCMLVIFVFP